MQIPVKITYRNVAKNEAIEALVREKAARLDRFCDHIMGCSVAIEKPQKHQKSGNPYRVRITLTVPPGHELVARREPGEGSLQEDLSTVVRSAFAAARRQLQRLVQQQRGQVKEHPAQQLAGIVKRLFREQGYGFLKTLDDREIYFHRNSVLGNEFDRLEIGTGVRYAAEMGDKGLQATTVQIVDKPGARAVEGKESHKTAQGERHK